MMLEAARKHEECLELEALFIFGPTPRPDANWGFGIAGKENKVSVASYMRLDQIASRLQRKYELHPVKADRRDIEARVWSLVHDRPTLKAWLSRGGAYDLATFRKLQVSRIGQWNGILTISWPKLPSPAASHSAAASSRRDDPQRLLQAIDGVRNGALVGIGYHVSGVIYQMQI